MIRKSDDTPAGAQGAAGSRGAAVAPGPRSLDPRSKSCWIPALIGLGLMAAAYVGIKRIEASAGVWAVEAARNALATSGLRADDRGAIEAQIERLDDALEAKSIDTRATTKGVDAILQKPLMQLLTLLDVRDRMLPASGLDEAERASAAEALGTLASYVDAGIVGLDRLNTALGPLATETAPGQGRTQASDDELMAVVAAAGLEVEAVPASRLDAVDVRPVTRDVLLADLEAAIDSAVAPPEAE